MKGVSVVSLLANVVTTFRAARHRDRAALGSTIAERVQVTRASLVGEVTGSIAHDVAQPITGIITCGEAAQRWLQKPVPDIGEVSQLMAYILEDAQRAADVVSRIRVMGQKQMPGYASMDLNATVKASIEIMRRDLRAQGILVRLNFFPALPDIIGDRAQLQQVMMDLVINGAEAMRETARKPKVIEVTTSRVDSNHVSVAVRDSGAGIRAGHVAHVFAPFFTTKADGIGMGLCVCRSIVQAHGGKIWVESPKDGGALFQFILPLERIS